MRGLKPPNELVLLKHVDSQGGHTLPAGTFQVWEACRGPHVGRWNGFVQIKRGDRIRIAPTVALHTFCGYGFRQAAQAGALMKPVTAKNGVCQTRPPSIDEWTPELSNFHEGHTSVIAARAGTQRMGVAPCH